MHSRSTSNQIDPDRMARAISRAAVQGYHNLNNKMVNVIGPNLPITNSEELYKHNAHGMIGLSKKDDGK